jgi:two-component system KDP operon response regulator KdpE
MVENTNNQCILIVDDDPRIIRLVREVLSAVGYRVLVRNEGQQAIEAIALEQPDLVVLDILMENLDGYQVCRRVREFSDVPIIMLTAKVMETDMLAGFEAGADDYITKPFSSKELLARVRAVMKRAHQPTTPTGEALIECGDMQVDLARRKVSIAGVEVHLTATEYNLLHHLATHPNQVLTHEQLLVEVWGPQYRNDIDYLRSYIHYLRKKLERDPSNPQFIITIQGVGYMLCFPEGINKEG